MDKTLSVTSARQQLLKLTKDIRRRMDRVVLTNKGEAAAVLMSVGEYNSLKAAAELAMRPDVLKATEEGFEQIRRGEGKTLEEAFPGDKTTDEQSEAVWKKIMGSSCAPAEIPTGPGIYAVLLNSNTALPQIGASENDLLYIGRTDANLALRDHFVHEHSGFSTLRRSIGALLKHELQLQALPRAPGPSKTNVTNYRFQEGGEKALTGWMKGNLVCRFAPLNHDVDATERDLIRKKRPPINLTGWPNPFREYLKSLRNICRDEALRQRSPESERSQS